MSPLSAQQETRSRKNLSALLKALCNAGQSSTASAIGLHESTVSRWKDGELEKLALFMAVVGLKVVPAEMRCYRPEEIEALQVLARRSDVLRADALVGGCGLMWHEYEYRKRQWVAANPNATCAEYDRAIRKICKDLGL